MSRPRAKSDSAKKDRLRAERAGGRGLLRSFLWRFMAWLAALAAICAGAFFFWIDSQVQERFGNPLWEVPVHIYSQPFELYPGLSISPEQLAKRLRSSGYRESQTVRHSGQYAITSGGIDVITRAFVFWDGPQPSVNARIELAGNQISVLRNLDSGAALPFVRLRPVLMGSLSDEQHQDRYLVRLTEMPPLFLSTLLAVEDRNFVYHRGVDVRAIGRAFVSNLLAGRIVQGGSTLTQQLVKNVFGRGQRSYSRKLLEIATALVLEYRLSKDQILEAYCNEVFLGQDGKRAVHGFELGSRYLFGRPAAELNAAEIAQLVGMVKAPTSYHPGRHPQRARQRRQVVLDVMRDQDLITAAEHQRYSAAELTLAAAHDRSAVQYGSFVDYVLRKIKHQNVSSSASASGYSVFTTMDVEVQQAAEKALKRQLKALEERYSIASGALQGGIVVVRPDDGEILALAGGRRTYIGEFNRSVDARRPIGSLLKPLIYMTALTDSRNWTLSTVVADRPVSYKTSDGGTWSPKNFDDEFAGDVTVLTALAESRNVPAVRVGMSVGLRKIAAIVAKMGHDLPRPVYPSMLLGAVEMSPFEVAQIYQTLANYGYKIPLRAISKISENAREITNPIQLGSSSAVPSDPAALTLFAMQESVRSGTGKGLAKTFPDSLGLAGKTGTTDDFRDSWFVGLSGNLLGVVWVGRDDNQPVGLTGSAGALRVWEAMMSRLNLQPLRISGSGNLDFVAIDLKSGLKASPRCQRIRTVPYIRNSQPQKTARC